MFYEVFLSFREGAFGNEPCWHFMIWLRFSFAISGIFLRIFQALPERYGMPKHFMKCQISPDAYDIYSLPTYIFVNVHFFTRKPERKPHLWQPISPRERSGPRGQNSLHTGCPEMSLRRASLKRSVSGIHHHIIVNNGWLLLGNPYSSRVARITLKEITHL